MTRQSIFTLTILLTIAVFCKGQNPLKKLDKGFYLGISADVYNTLWTPFEARDLDDALLPQGVSVVADYVLSQKLSFSTNFNYALSPAIKRANRYDEYLNLENSKLYGFDILFKYHFVNDNSLPAPFGRYLGIGIVYKQAEVLIPKMFTYDYIDENDALELTGIYPAEYYKGNSMGPSCSYGFTYALGKKMLFDLGFQFSFLLFSYENGGVGEYSNAPEQFVFDRNLTKAYYRLIIPIR